MKKMFAEDSASQKGLPDRLAEKTKTGEYKFYVLFLIFFIYEN
jgi:hypothetical protein